MNRLNQSMHPRRKEMLSMFGVVCVVVLALDASYTMSIKRIVEERLGHEVGLLAKGDGTNPTRVLTVGYSSTQELSVFCISPADTAVLFNGLYCPFGEVTLLIDRAVAADWGLLK